METQGRSPQIMVERALEYLKEYVNMRRKDFIEPAIVHVSLL
jgi:hypothetical protein